MSSKSLSQRDNWQTSSGLKAGEAENDFYSIISNLFTLDAYNHLVIIKKPQDFNSIYIDVVLTDDVLAKIYQPETKILKHGIIPDFKILNLNTQKSIFVEVKRQDGWVENGERKDGRGNAHERMCKYFTPGLLKVLRSRSGILGSANLPFWLVLKGNITRDPLRVREMSLWFDEYQSHLFMWHDSSSSSIEMFFKDKILPLIS